MASQTEWIMSLTWMVVTLVGGGNVFAQKPTQEKAPAPQERDVLVERHEMTVAAPAEVPHRMPFSGGPMGAADGNTVIFLSSEMSFDGKTVKGAPYSAQAVTEFTQTLADGNRIVRKTNASVYRDGEGRTRRDQTLPAIGSWATAGDPPQTVFINDPVAGVNYILDPRDKTARKLGLPKVEIRERKPAAGASDPAAKGPGKRVEEFELALPGEGAAIAQFHRSGDDNAKKESLGKQTIEGIEAEGTRVTMTIPAGEFGNEQPMHIVSEQWYSPALQTVVMSRHSDPRSGETIYRLTGIDRSEPARSLFEVPSDYSLKDGVPEPVIRRFEVRKPKGTE